MRRTLIFVLLTICALGSYASIYMQTDKQGNIVYTDMPSGNAQVVNTGFSNTISTSEESPPSNPEQPAATQGTNNIDSTVTEISKQPYQAFSIASPTDQETIQNQPSFTVRFNIQPSLQQGDMIQLYIDGSTWGGPSKNSDIVVTQLDRGTHQLSGKLLDSTNKVLKESKTITVYIHRANVNVNPS